MFLQKRRDTQTHRGTPVFPQEHRDTQEHPQVQLAALIELLATLNTRIIYTGVRGHGHPDTRPPSGDLPTPTVRGGSVGYGPTTTNSENRST